jgi:hypothetical protein
METRKVFIDAQCMSDTQIFRTIITLRRRDNAYSRKIEQMSPSKVLRYLKIVPRKLTKDTMATIFLAQNTQTLWYEEQTVVHDTYYVNSVNLKRDTRLVPPYEIVNHRGQSFPIKDESWESGIRDGIEKRNKFGFFSLYPYGMAKIDGQCSAHNFSHLKHTLYNFYKINRNVLKNQTQETRRSIILSTLSVFVRVYKLLYDRDLQHQTEFLAHWERQKKMNPKQLEAYFNREVTVVDILPSKRRRPAIISHARYREKLKQQAKLIKKDPLNEKEVGDFELFPTEF